MTAMAISSLLPVFVNYVLLKHSHTHLFICCLYGCFHPAMAELAVATETVSLTKLKVFAIGPVTESWPTTNLEDLGADRTFLFDLLPLRKLVYVSDSVFSAVEQLWYPRGQTDKLTVKTSDWIKYKADIKCRDTLQPCTSLFLILPCLVLNLLFQPDLTPTSKSIFCSSQTENFLKSMLLFMLFPFPSTLFPKFTVILPFRGLSQVSPS